MIQTRYIKKFYLVLGLAILVLVFISSPPLVKAQIQGGDLVKIASNQLLVKLDTPAAEQLKKTIDLTSDKSIDYDGNSSDRTGFSGFDILAEQNKIKSIRPLVRSERVNKRTSHIFNWFLIELPGKNSFINQLDLEYQNIESLAMQIKDIPGVESVEKNHLITVSYIPNDPSYSSQWHLPKIGNPEAIDRAVGINLTNSPKVAILDTGINWAHSDLSAHVISNTDLVGSQYGALDIMGHGTHVAGIVGAVYDNSIYGVGISPLVSLMNVKVIADNGSGISSNLINGIIYAADNGSDVISMSLGNFGNCPASVQDAVDYAYEEGNVLVAAAGNNNLLGLHWPGSCDHVISVAATDSNDAKASFSNYGSLSGNFVDISAPGNQIYSTLKDGTFGVMSGTSMSTPVVAGTAAFMLSTAMPPSDNNQLERIIYTTTDKIAQTGNYWRYGRVNSMNIMRYLSKQRDGLKSYWTMDQGGNTLTDHISANNATSVGTTSVSGKQKSSRDFTGQNQYISVANIAAYSTSTMTISAWIKPGSSMLSNNTWASIFNRRNSSNEGGMTLEFNADGQHSAGTIDCDLDLDVAGGRLTYYRVISTSQVQANQWNHVACVYDGSKASIYINGSLAGQGNQVGTIHQASNLNIQIGRNLISGESFEGEIDEVGLWSRALDEKDIKELYEGFNPNSPIRLTAFGTCHNGNPAIDMDFNDIESANSSLVYARIISPNVFYNSQGVSKLSSRPLLITSSEANLTPGSTYRVGIISSVGIQSQQVDVLIPSSCP